MAELLRGAPVAAALNEKTAETVRSLQELGVTPTLAILRVGERQDDLSYERGVMRSAAKVGVAVKSVSLPAEVECEAFFGTLEALNRDEAVHGILMFRPLPAWLDEQAACDALAPEKDVDGCTGASFAGVYADRPLGFVPCTAQAVVELLDYYGIPCRGKRAVILGRSLVVGRPLAMLLLHKDATVTLCHSRTENAAALAAGADILVACTGRMESVDAAYIRPGQIVVDVGISWNEEKQKLCGDVLPEAAETAAAVTPVPGGVGAVTTAVLLSHVAEAARRASRS